MALLNSTGVSDEMSTRKNKERKKKKKLPPVGWKKVKKAFVYYFTPGKAKNLEIKKITFLGFKEHPTGLSLYDSGGGFNQRQSKKIGGDIFLRFLKERYGKKINLTIFKKGTGSNSFSETQQTVSVRLSFGDFFEVLKDLGTEAEKRRREIVQKRLARFLPKEFSSSKEDVSGKLGDINLINFRQGDHEAISDFLKKYLNVYASNSKVIKKINTQFVIQGRKKTLDNVIIKFEENLKNKEFDEKKWQKFLHEEVFFFLSNYVESVREANVNFGKEEDGAKKPDFVWIDLYGFLDVFEIKTPNTSILSKSLDASHKNYYFSSAASKAISQIEKYILFLERNVENFEKYLTRQTSIPFSVLKPKAFLIIGQSRELESHPNKKKDFRLLRRALKNIEFITFDELLDNLKNLSNKFGEEKKKMVHKRNKKRR